MANPQYLIGQGEKLSQEIARPPRGMGDKAHPYEFFEARRRLTPQWKAAADAINLQPALAQPGGEAVLEVTLHPSYLAKSYYPNHLMRELSLRHLGSRATHIIPDKVVSSRAVEQGAAQPAPVLYVGGDAKQLTHFASEIANWAPRREDVQDEFRQIENVGIPGDSRLKPLRSAFTPGDEVPLEVVLHAPLDDSNGMIVAGFREYVRSIGLDIDLRRARQAGGLCFVPLRAPVEKLPEVLQFSFLRALREVARINPFEPALRMSGPAFPVTIGAEAALAPDLSVAIFDGGLPAGHGLERWVTTYDAPGVGNAFAAAQNHGLQVTSAFLFGPLQPGTPHTPPFSNVDHWRIIGDDHNSDDFELFSLLDRIEGVLTSRTYDLVNISVGPDCAIEDDDVNVWTSTLDALLSSGETVATVACGNNGERDSVARLHRVQPPSDGVNMLAVGASDKIGTDWRRAPYSACGPGRSPGYIKPDFVAFGGSPGAPFLALTSGSPASACGTMGTSFASPLALRGGAGVRAQFSTPLWAPTVKALLVHAADPGTQNRSEVGWGLVPHELGDLVLCGDGEAHIVYQRQMPETGAVRFFLPIPAGLPGMVEIKATFCFYCDVDPEDALNYTRAGLDVQFRPDTLRIPPPYMKDGRLITPTVPKSDSFFSAKDVYTTEHMRRSDAQKWETTLSRSKSKRATSLHQPAFDVGVIYREHGHDGRRPANMKVALVVTVRNRGTVDLYDRVVAGSGNRLQPLRPRANVPIPIRSRG
ncbi:S8 family peptidase [Sphingomonas sp. Leaf67]|uniref:S8 family peptidase n=1 Tax=Sphingomonas sp. Leaf67 TaxID=1736230 RepID=UPI000A665CBA|nr:S8 family peptidase [Sphingomonas sp. Leaf67]